MYVAEIHIENYRCFDNLHIEFCPGVNVIIGENNSGKTALLKALGLVFDRGHRGRLGKYDFYQGVQKINKSPSIIISVTLKSSETDTDDDMSLVATWLLNPDEDLWEAKLTYKYYLPESEAPEFEKDLGTDPDHDHFWNTVERYLPKYVSHIYGGLPEARNRAESEELRKFDFQFLDAIRNVEAELFSGANPMFKSMLTQVLDLDVKDERERLKRTDKFRVSSDQLRRELVDRLDLDTLFNLIEDTGAKDGGEPGLDGNLNENDLITALRLFIGRENLNLPANYNGLGYNNLVYISLVLASLDFNRSFERLGQNATVFPMLVIEEPEAHLHPALQYRLLKYLQSRMDQGMSSRQIFITTHSTHITAASGLGPIICMSISDTHAKVRVSYPGKVFPDNREGQRSKRFIERYLDATKSNMLFVKGIIFVEGIAEQILVPCFAEYVGSPLEESHVAVISVSGLNFKHFLPIFGAGTSKEKKKYSLLRPVACIIDADPTSRQLQKGERRKRCWPYQVGFDLENHEYFPLSGAVQNLKELVHDAGNIIIKSGSKTLEYDLAIVNSNSKLLITSACVNRDELMDFIERSDKVHQVLKDTLANEVIDALERLPEDTSEKKQAAFATYYSVSVESVKGDHAFQLEHRLRENHDRSSSKRESFEVPEYIEKAIHWATGRTEGEAL